MCEVNEYSLYDLKQLAIDDLMQALDYNDGEFYEDLIHETVDACVPIYTSDLMGYAFHNIQLATAEPEIIAFDGKATPVNVIAGNIYEWLYTELSEYVRDNQLSH